jgi:membrane protease subunit (stomatin/prohibitin family)
MKKFIDLKWGTKSPINFRDTELSFVQLRASGKFSMRVKDPQLFINEIVGTQGKYTTNEIEDYLRDSIVSKLNSVLGKNLKTVFDRSITRRLIRYVKLPISSIQWVSSLLILS